MKLQIHKENWNTLKGAITQFECMQVGCSIENMPLKLILRRENTTDFKISEQDLEKFINRQIKLN